MPEVYDISNPVPDDPKKKSSASPKAANGPKKTAVAPKTAGPTIQIGSTGDAYKPKHKGRPKPLSPRVVKMRLAGLGVVIAIALVFIAFQLLGGKKESSTDARGQSVTSNPNIAPATAIRTVPAKPTYRSRTNVSPSRANIPSFAPVGERPGERQGDQGEGIH
jgi:hypothetical protein